MVAIDISRMVQEEGTLEAIVSMTEVMPDMQAQIMYCAMDRASLMEYYPDGEPEDLQKVKERHALLVKYKNSYDHQLRRYKDLMVSAIVNALEEKRKDNPEKYNALAERVAALVRNTGDKLILPIYSRRRTEITRNSANGGGIYDVQVILPNGESLDLIAKKFENKEDFATDVFSEDNIGEGVLAIDEREHVKIEFNKGRTTLTERIVSAESYEKFTLLYEVAKRVVREIKRAEKRRQQFVEPRDLPQKLYDIVRDTFSRKRHDLGVRYVVKQVDDFTQDFIDRWVYRLSPDMRPERYDRKKGRKVHPAVKRLYKVMKEDIEHVLQKQKRHVINWDLNGGNVLFDDEGRIKTCDRELTRIDLVQKCAYDLTEKQNLTPEQEMSIADLFYHNLDLEIDHEHFRQIYNIRKMMEDLVFTKYLEYSNDPIRADTDQKKQVFRDGALYYFNRAMRAADRHASDRFKTAVVDLVNEMGLADKLYPVSDEEFATLEKRVLGSDTLNLTQDPLEKLKMLFSTEMTSAATGRDLLYGHDRRPRESGITRRLVIGAAIGVGMGLFLGSMQMCSVMEDRMQPETNPVTDAQFLQMTRQTLGDVDLSPRAIEVLQQYDETYGSMGGHNIIHREVEQYFHISGESFERMASNGNRMFGTSSRLFQSIAHSLAVNDPDPSEFEGRMQGPYLVPESYVMNHIIDDRERRRIAEGDRDHFNEFGTDIGGPAFAASSRYLRHCQITNGSDITNTIAQYFLGGNEQLREVMIRAGSDHYFDSTTLDMNDMIVVSRGYRSELSETERELIDTAIYFYIHTNPSNRAFVPHRIYGPVNEE